MERTCKGCDAKLAPMQRPGRPKLWCSDACRVRAHREDKKQYGPKCADCGLRMWPGKGVLPEGQARCRPCRSSRRLTETSVAEPLPLRFCKTCETPFEPKQRTQIYCQRECRPREWGRRAVEVRTTPQKGYGYAHQQARKAWATLVDEGEVDCALCGDPIEPGAVWHLDHTEDRTDYRGPAHAACNLRDGAVRGNQTRHRKAAA